MVGVLSIGLFGMLAAGVTAVPTNFKRQTSNEEIFVFRSDLREGEDQSPMFKDLLRMLFSPPCKISADRDCSKRHWQ